MGISVDKNWIKIVFLSAAAFLLVLCSYFFIDERVARAINRLWMTDRRFAFLYSDIPDLLSYFVGTITIGAWIAYLSLVRRGRRNIHVWFFQLIATAIPISFIVKSVLKFMVGRIETRFWLRHPHFEGFHWFHGVGHYTGFPSGHMTVFMVLVLALWKYYPRYRPAYLGLLAVLALSLLATAYHFVSDIIAGAYIGFLVFYAIDRIETNAMKSDNRGREGMVTADQQ